MSPFRLPIVAQSFHSDGPDEEFCLRNKIEFGKHFASDKQETKWYFICQSNPERHRFDSDLSKKHFGLCESLQLVHAPSLTGNKESGVPESCRKRHPVAISNTSGQFREPESASSTATDGGRGWGADVKWLSRRIADLIASTCLQVVEQLAKNKRIISRNINQIRPPLAIDAGWTPWCPFFLCVWLAFCRPGKKKIKESVSSQGKAQKEKNVRGKKLKCCYVS